MSNDPFWKHIAEQYEALRSARTVDDVLTICPPVMSTGERAVADGFFEGGGGDLRVEDALGAAGWTTVKRQAWYYWVLRAPDDGLLTYIEGDLYRGDKMMAL